MKSSMRLPYLASAALLAFGTGPALAVSLPESEPNHPIDSAHVLPGVSQVEVDGEIRRWNLENDVDFYTFRAQEGDVLTVDIDYGFGVGESVDTIVAVFGPGPDYRLLRLSDDARPDPGSVHSYDSRIDNFVVPATGTYTVGVSSYPRYFTNGGDTRNSYYLDEGDYTLIIDGMSPAVTQIPIEIKPGSDEPAPINPRSRGKIPVALLGSADFDVADVDTSSLTFGATGTERSLHKCAKRGEDVNDDGYLDLVCHFNNQDTGFRRGHVEGYLKGQMKAKTRARGASGGMPFEGGAWLKVVPEKPND